MASHFRVGIVGITGYGGGEVLRLCAAHPDFRVTYAAGDSSAGQKLGERFPGVTNTLADLVIGKFDPAACADLDVLFASLPTGESKSLLAAVPTHVRIVDIGGDHRYADGWTYGMADAWPDEIRATTRVANPGCFPAASLTALVPLLEHELIAPSRIVINALTGVSGAGRGGTDNKFGFADVNEDATVYGLLKHAHMPEIAATILRCSGPADGLIFTPHLVPMTRGILATIYCQGSATTERCLQAARTFYGGRPFVRVLDKAPHSKWATGSNSVFLSYAADPTRDLVIAMAAIDNLGKGAAGMAVQNANLMCGLDETAGLNGMPVWP